MEPAKSFPTVIRVPAAVVRLHAPLWSRRHSRTLGCRRSAEKSPAAANEPLPPAEQRQCRIQTRRLPFAQQEVLHLAPWRCAARRVAKTVCTRDLEARGVFLAQEDAPSSGVRASTKCSPFAGARPLGRNRPPSCHFSDRAAESQAHSADKSGCATSHALETSGCINVLAAPKIDRCSSCRSVDEEMPVPPVRRVPMSPE